MYQKRYDEAIGLCRHVLANLKVKADNTAMSVVYLVLGDVYRATARLNKAAACYQKAMALQPSGEAKRRLDEIAGLRQKSSR
jgi:tetratricopeptide (TPR) repeat protein